MFQIINICFRYTTYVSDIQHMFQNYQHILLILKYRKKNINILFSFWFFFFFLLQMRISNISTNPIAFVWTTLKWQKKRCSAIQSYKQSGVDMFMQCYLKWWGEGGGTMNKASKFAWVLLFNVPRIFQNKTIFERSEKMP